MCVLVKGTSPVDPGGWTAPEVTPSGSSSVGTAVGGGIMISAFTGVDMALSMGGTAKGEGEGSLDVGGAFSELERSEAISACLPDGARATFVVGSAASSAMFVADMQGTNFRIMREREEGLRAAFSARARGLPTVVDEGAPCDAVD